jgi:hypothetical protein
MAYLFKLSSRLIVERHLPTIASDAYGIGFVEETRTTYDQYCGCIAKVSDRINKCAKFGNILLGVSREDDENIVSHRVLIKF